MIFWIRLAESQQEKEHRQLQSVLFFTQTQKYVDVLKTQVIKKVPNLWGFFKIYKTFRK